MEGFGCEGPSVKRIKLDVEECSTEKEAPIVVEGSTQVGNFKSPITDPVLTPEIWVEIVRRLSGDDFISVINATPEWNHLLGSRKTTELFPMLVHLLLPYLDVSDILACRQIQLGSKAAVDKLLEAHGYSDDSFSRHYQNTFVFPQFEKITEKYALTSRQDIEEFSNALELQTKGPSYNPFLTRSLDVGVDMPWNENEADHVAMTEFLSTFGTHVWHLNFNFDDIVEQSAISKLNSYLHRLPQLKILQLCEQVEEVQLNDPEFLRNCELPPLSHLSQLNFLDFGELSVVSWFVQRYGAQLSTLLVRGSWIRFWATDIKSLLPKLKRLRVEDVDERVLEKLSVVDWSVECLSLQLSMSLRHKRELLLSTLSNFKHSVTHLELNLWAFFNSGHESDSQNAEELTSIGSIQVDEEAMMIAEAAFKMSTKMEKLVAYYETAAKREDGKNLHKIKIVKSQPTNLAEETQYKIIHELHII